jgi:hypothetical protein
MSSINDQLSIAFSNAQASACCVSCADANDVRCLEFSTIVARRAIIQTLHTGETFSNIDTVRGAIDCAGNTVFFYTLSSRYGIFSSITITNDYLDYRNTPESSNAFGEVNLYDTLVMKDAYFEEAVVPFDISPYSTQCLKYGDPIIPGTIGPTGPTGPAGPTPANGNNGLVFWADQTHASVNNSLSIVNNYDSIFVSTAQLSTNTVILPYSGKYEFTVSGWTNGNGESRVVGTRGSNIIYDRRRNAYASNSLFTNSFAWQSFLANDGIQFYKNEDNTSTIVGSSADQVSPNYDAAGAIHIYYHGH